MPKSQHGLNRLLNALNYSCKGLQATFKSEAAFREEVFLSIILLPLAFILGDSGLEKAALIASVLLVLIVELFNSGIEAVVDRFGGELHELSGKAKDIGSAAVLLSLINVIVVWVLILLF